MAEPSEVLHYDRSILETIRHVEDVNVKFALQNYAATGAVFLAYYAGKLPLRIAAPAAVVLSLAFTWAIWLNILRYKLFWQMHCIARNNWLATQSELRDQLRVDADCAKYLNLTTLPAAVFRPTVVISLLPMAGALAIVGWRLWQLYHP